MSKGIELGYQIPWALSDVHPHRLTTLADMTPEQKEVAIRDAEVWTRSGLATQDKCSRCPRYYNEPSPDCPNFREHAADPDEENPCEVLVDLGIKCGKPIARTVEEPFTPGRFQIECCDDCCRSFISQGYKEVA